MTVKLGGWALFECDDCGGQFAALVTYGADLYCTNCGKKEIVPENIELANSISFNIES